jgi:hypothetical protein
MRTEREVKRIHALLSSGVEVTDEECLGALEEYDKQLQTNCGSAAAALFDAISPVCYFKPHLVEKLLHYPIRPLIYLGFEDMETFSVYLSDVLLSSTAPYRSHSDAEGRHWLQHELPKVQNVVACVLQEELEKNNAEMNSL